MTTLIIFFFLQYNYVFSLAFGVYRRESPLKRLERQQRWPWKSWRRRSMSLVMIGPPWRIREELVPASNKPKRNMRKSSHWSSLVIASPWASIAGQRLEGTPPLCLWRYIVVCVWVGKGIRKKRNDGDKREREREEKKGDGKWIREKKKGKGG